MSTKDESKKHARAVGGGRVYYPKKGDDEKMVKAFAKAFPRTVGSNGQLLESAKAGIEVLFSDTSVSRQICRENLTELRDEIDQKLACLDDDSAMGLA